MRAAAGPDHPGQNPLAEDPGPAPAPSPEPQPDPGLLGAATEGGETSQPNPNALNP